MYKPSFFITTLTGSSIIWSLHFLPAWRSKRGIWYGNVAGWLGGCPSQAGIVSKRLNPSENFFDHLVAPQFYFPLTPAMIPDSKGNPFSGGVKQMGVEKNWQFSTEITVYYLQFYTKEDMSYPGVHSFVCLWTTQELTNIDYILGVMRHMNSKNWLDFGSGTNHILLVEGYRRHGGGLCSLSASCF